MDVNKEQAQVPEEALEEVSGGRWMPSGRVRFVCNQCRMEKGIPINPIINVSRAQEIAQQWHDRQKGATGTCTNGKMEQKS